MKAIIMMTLLGDFQQTLVIWFGAVFGVALIAARLFLVATLKDHGLSFRRFIWSQVVGFSGGAGVILFMQAVTQCAWSDFSGPIDLLILMGIYMTGWTASALLFYAIAGLALDGAAEHKKL